MIHFFLLLILSIPTYNHTSPVSITDGGTELSTWPATYAILAGGTTNISSLQTCASTSTSGQVLTTIQSSILPSFQNNSYGFVLLQTLTASSSATLTLTNTDFAAAYDVFMIQLDNIQPSVTTDYFLALFSSDNGSSYFTTTYRSGLNYTAYNSATVTNVNSAIDVPLSVANNPYVSGTLYFYQKIANFSTTSASFINGFTVCGYPGLFCMISGMYFVNLTLINNIQFKFSTGNITQGVIRLYGITYT